jgi:hypothetical protein
MRRCHVCGACVHWTRAALCQATDYLVELRSRRIDCVRYMLDALASGAKRLMRYEKGAA